MKKIITSSYYLIPPSKRNKLPILFLYSFINSVLDLLSIVYLVPVILILLDKNKVEQLTLEYFNLTLSNTLILSLLGSLIVFYILKNGIQSAIIRLQSKFIYKISNALSEKLMRQFVSENYKAYTQTDKNVFFRDAFQLPITFATSILSPIYAVFSELLILSIILTIGFIYQPLATFLAFVLLVVLTCLLLFIQKKKVDAFNLSIVNLYQENVKNILNIFHGFIEIKMTKSEEKFLKKFNQTNKKSNLQLGLLMAFKQTNAKYFEVLFILGLSFGLLFFLYYKNNTSDLILLSFFVGSSIKIVPSFTKILNAILDIKANSNVVSLLKNQLKTEWITAKEINCNQHIHLKNIDFDFEQKSVLTNVTIDIELGDFITISGNSGEGKSTLLQLISGLLTPKSGSIFIDDVELNSNYSTHEFIGYVPQQPFLFHGSILENVTMLHEEVNSTHLQEILTALNLDDWINQLPNGVQTQLLMESKQLSGGQKQRIALARALYFKPKIIILDEATNQLDTSLEEHIVSYLYHQTKSKKLTVIAVSHGNKMESFANKKFILKNGTLSAT